MRFATVVWAAAVVAWCGPAQPMPGDQRQAFNQAIQAVNKAYEAVMYPYSKMVTVVRTGESRIEVTTFIDSREHYCGKNSFGRLSEGNTAAREAMTAAREALSYPPGT